MPDLSDILEDAAAEPVEARGDAGSIRQRSLAELIEADRYLKSRDGLRRTDRGLKLTKLSPPGTV
jgi:hypothetical protein